MKLFGRFSRTTGTILISLPLLGCSGVVESKRVSLEVPGETPEERIGLAQRFVTEERLSLLKSQLKNRLPSITDNQLAGLGLSWSHSKGGFSEEHSVGNKAIENLTGFITPDGVSVNVGIQYDRSFKPEPILQVAGDVLKVALNRPAAEKGSAVAQHKLGIAYSFGEGVPQDYGESLRWYQLAADQGYAPAQHNLGAMYDQGQGVPQNYREAAEWYRRAALQGVAADQNVLGDMYNQGQGVPQDYGEALKWFRLAADQGYAMAQTNLGVMYADGSGGYKDFVQAYFWLSLAITGADLDVAKRRREDISTKMTRTQITEAQALVRKWTPRPQALLK